MRIYAIPLVLGTLATAIAILGLVGWGFNIVAFREFIPGFPAMVPVTAVSTLLQALAVVAFARTRSHLGHGFAGTALIIPILVLFEYGLGRSLGIDTLLFEHDVIRAMGWLYPGRMSPHTAIASIFSALALLTLRGSKPIRAVFITQWFALGTVVSTLVAIVGHIHGIVGLFGISPLIGMSLPTASALLAIACGILTLTPDRGIVGLLRLQGGTGILVRRLFAASIFIPLALAILIWFGERAGYFDFQLGHALFIVAAICMYTSFVVWAARGMAVAEEGRLKLALEEAATLRATEERDKQIALASALRQSQAWLSAFSKTSRAKHGTCGSEKPRPTSCRRQSLHARMRWTNASWPQELSWNKKSPSRPLLVHAFFWSMRFPLPGPPNTHPIAAIFILP